MSEAQTLALLHENDGDTLSGTLLRVKIEHYDVSRGEAANWLTTPYNNIVRCSAKLRIGDYMYKGQPTNVKDVYFSCDGK